MVAATNITASPGQTIHIRQIDTGVRELQYKIDSGSWSSGLALPITFVNSDPGSGNIFVVFDTNIVVDQPSVRFIVGSDGIQIGSRTLNPDGTRTLITVLGIAGYVGFVNNVGYNNISVYNLHVVSDGSTIATSAGWVGGYAYGTDGVNNYIFYCSSDGPISDFSGGIVGGEACTKNVAPNCDLTIIGCSSSGSIGSNGGGIAGEYLGQSGGVVTLLKCWSTGTIGTSGGGIAGLYPGQGGGNVSAIRCYSTGIIGTNGGGILGESAGEDGFCSTNFCYSRGTISDKAGGMFGRYAGVLGNAIADSCYSSGSIQSGGFGIFGGSPGTAIATNCYVANGSWSTLAANAILSNVDYVSPPGTNQPFLLRAFGPSPYRLETVPPGGEDLNTLYCETLPAGTQSIPGVTSGLIYALLENTAGVSINASTGSITAPSTTKSYPLIVLAQNGTGYSVTNVVLTVTGSVPTPLAVPEPRGKGADFEIYTDTKIGKRLVQERLQNPNIRFNSFADYHKYKMALLKK